MTCARFVCFAAVLAFHSLAGGQSRGPNPVASPSPLEQKLRDSRFELHLENGEFTGSAAPVLEKAIAEAKYVLIGEDHLTREIPEFTSVVCAVMAREGLSAMAVEAGPQAAKFISSTFAKPDRVVLSAALLHQYPDSIAFLNMRQENDLAAHCAELAGSKFRLWGLDQEFQGSAGWLLDEILATHPGPSASKALRRLQNEEQQAAALARQSGDSTKLFLVTVSDAELREASLALEHDGNPSANALFRELVGSHEIYAKALHDLPESVNERARLLKQHFRQDVEEAKLAKSEKVLIKFGDYHLYKGFNLIHQRELGIYIAELADSEGSVSLHICVLGVKGVHRFYGGYERPTKLQHFVTDGDITYYWLKPAIDNSLPGAWTLFDLRRMRFQNLGSVDPGMERLLYGFDLLVIAPELTPADPIE